MQPFTFRTGARVETLLLVSVGDFDHDERARAGRQFLQAAADGRQCRFVAGEKIPVEIVGHDERAARAADAEKISGPRLRRPRRRRAIAVQDEIDQPTVCRGIVAARRVVARRRPRRIGGYPGRWARVGNTGLACPGWGKKSFTDRRARR